MIDPEVEDCGWWTEADAVAARREGGPHDHTEYVEGCFRCVLSRDETAVIASGEQPDAE